MEENKDLFVNERHVADDVADEILYEEKKSNTRFLVFLLIFLICLIFLVASISFAVLNAYNVGSTDNTINAGSILFSFSEDSANINIVNAMPVTDEYGKNNISAGEYLDFTVSVAFSGTQKDDYLDYELSLIPLDGNTLDGKYVRVYLLENGKELSINGNTVNSFYGLYNSSFSNYGKILIKRSITQNQINEYRLVLWVSEDYPVSTTSEEFKCKIAINAYNE